MRYAWQVSDFTCEGCSASSSTPWFSGGGIKQKRYSWAGAHTWVLSPRMLNEVRGQWTNYHFRQHPPGVEPQEDLFDNSPARAAPLTAVYTFPSLTWGTSGNFYTKQISRELRDDMSITAGTHTWKFGAGAQELADHGDNRPSARHVDVLGRPAVQPGEPRVVRAGGRLGAAVRDRQPREAADVYAERHVELLRRGRMEAGRRRDVEPRSSLRLSVAGFNQGLTLDSKDQVYGIPLFPTTGTAASLAPLVDFDQARRQEQLRSARRLRVGRAQRRARRSSAPDYGIYYNPMNLQITSAEMANFRQPTANIANPTYPDPYGGRDPLRSSQRRRRTSR